MSSTHSYNPLVTASILLPVCVCMREREGGKRGEKIVCALRTATRLAKSMTDCSINKIFIAERLTLNGKGNFAFITII